MASSPSPIEIGTRGTIGSLVFQEIEYFKQIDTNHRRSYRKSKNEIQDMAPRSTSSVDKKKKHSVMRSGGGFLPCICSTVDVGDAGGAGYMNLSADCNKFMQG